MTLIHAVAFVDHPYAEVLQFDSDNVVEHKVATIGLVADIPRRVDMSSIMTLCHLCDGNLSTEQTRESSFYLF